MNCYYHQERAAVAQCGKCGKGLCQECINKTEYTFDEKAMCRDCNRQTIDFLLEDDKKEKNKLIIKSAIILVCLIIGLIIYLSTQDAFTAIVICGIGGIPTAWKLTKRSDREKALDDIDDRLSDDGGLFNMLIRGIIRVVLVVAFGAVAAPILLIINTVRFFKLKKEIERLEQQSINFSY